MSVLEVRDVSKRYGSADAYAVHDVSLSMRRGEVLGVVGESGSGKSVTALSIMRLVQEPGRIAPASRIMFDGRDLTGLTDREMRKIRGNDIAMIFQEPMTSLNPVYPVGDQISESIRLHRGLSRKEARGRAVDLLRLVGIPLPDRRVDEYPHQLSGGMRQRVMIAMALANEPDLLIADEPTTALDVTIQAQILELLLELRQRLGMGVILITHDLGVVAEICDRVVVMYAGQVVEEGPVEEIFARPAHPYTLGLLAAVPRPDQRGGRLAVIPGTVPAPTRWPKGCRFRDRCPYAWDLCHQQPGLLEAGAHQHARCWLVEHPERRAEVEKRGGGFTRITAGRRGGA